MDSRIDVTETEAWCILQASATVAAVLVPSSPSAPVGLRDEAAHVGLGDPVHELQCVVPAAEARPGP